MKNYALGFTLIELMVAVALVSILAAVAVPLYQSFVLKSQVNRAITELASYKAAFETQVSNSGGVTNGDLGYVVSDLANGVGPIDIGQINADGSGHLQVTMGVNAHPRLSGLILRFDRTSAGSWRCVIDASGVSGWNFSLAPRACVVI